MSFLSDQVFKTIIKNTPLFSIDLVIINENKEILTGLRNNPPAKNYWFLPGGRVRKSETLDNAFSRISLNEIGVALDYYDSEVLGVYDHIWQDSIYGEEISTHYINCPMLVNTKAKDFEFSLDQSQHKQSKWTKLDEFDNDPSIHPLSKLFIPKLIQIDRDFNK